MPGLLPLQKSKPAPGPRSRASRQPPSLRPLRRASWCCCQQMRCSAAVACPMPARWQALHRVARLRMARFAPSRSTTRARRCARAWATAARMRTHSSAARRGARWRRDCSPTARSLRGVRCRRPGVCTRPRRLAGSPVCRAVLAHCFRAAHRQGRPASAKRSGSRRCISATSSLDTPRAERSRPSQQPRPAPDCAAAERAGCRRLSPRCWARSRGAMALQLRWYDERRCATPGRRRVPCRQPRQSHAATRASRI